MKKRLLVITCLILAVLLLCGCGSKKKADTVTLTPVQTAAPAPAETSAPAPAPAAPQNIAPVLAPTEAPAPVEIPASTAAPADAPAPALTAAPAPTPAPTAAPTPAPAAAPTPTPKLAASNLPVVTKDPTGETVPANGKCQFVTRYENAKWAEWHFVSPDGSRDLDYLQAGKEFPTLKIVNGYGKDMTLENIPAELNGWKVYCRFSNDSGAVKTATALITVKGSVTPGSNSSDPNLPRITKDPTGETVAIGGKCQFVTRYENAKLAEWHFVSPDGSRDLTYKEAQKEFPTLKILYGETKDLTLDKIPAELNGWKVYCRFSNDAGAVKTGSALITVKGAPVPAKRQGFEGRWADEVNGKCQIVVSYMRDGVYSVSVDWTNAAWQHARWSMTASVYKSDILTYSDGHYWLQSFTDDTHYTIDDERLNGTGSFYMENNKLHWVNDMTGENIVLIPA